MKAQSLYIASKYIDAVDLAYIMDTAPAPVGSEPLRWASGWLSESSKSIIRYKVKTPDSTPRLGSDQKAHRLK